MILCVGPTSAGKTLLLKRLKETETSDFRSNEMASTVPTVGMNIMKYKVKKNELSIHEIGGTVAPLWKQQASNCKALIYVIDAANLHQISSACIQLLELLSATSKRIPVLIVLNKLDLKSAASLNEFKITLRLDDIIRHASQNIEIIETSCFTGYGVSNLASWLKNLELSN